MLSGQWRDQQIWREGRLRLLFLLLIITPSVSFAAELRIAAAASLTYAMRTVAGQYQQQSGNHLLLTFGSSRTIARQIIQGAPFELFLSADEASVKLLTKHSLVEGEGVVYGRGWLVLYVPHRSTIQVEQGLKGIADALQQDKLQRLAIANPATAPYGAAAAEALRSAGLWQSLEKRLVLGENAMQTAQFALADAVDAALIPWSLALNPHFQQRGRYQRIATSHYQPLNQKMVLLRGASATARHFFEFMQSKQVTAILAAYGLSLNPASE